MEPLALTKIIAEDVGRPRDDGTPGSALYEVPIGLNRAPDPIERQLLVRHWDLPPQFTTMHRPGTMSVGSDRVVLRRTTVDEVERVHAKTLRLVLAQTNKDADAIRAEQAVRAAEQDRRHQEHADHVREVADRTEF